MSGGAELPPSVVKDGEKDKRGTFLTKKAIGVIVFLGIVLFFVVLIGINQHPHLATSGNGSSGNQPPPENSQVAASRVMSQFPSGRDLPMESPQVGKTIPKFQPLFKNAPIENSGGPQAPGPSSSPSGRAAYFQAPQNQQQGVAVHRHSFPSGHNPNSAPLLAYTSHEDERKAQKAVSNTAGFAAGAVPNGGPSGPGMPTTPYIPSLPGNMPGPPPMPSMAGSIPSTPGMAATPDYKSFNDQKGKEKFLKDTMANQYDAYLKSVRHKRMSDYEIPEGTVIPAVLLTRVDTDLPGDVEARTTMDVYNTIPGHYKEVLIPANSVLYGKYSSNITVGQTRVQVVWTRLRFPDKSFIDLKGMNGLDSSGSAGFHDQVDNHYMKIFGAALVLSVFTAGAELSQPTTGSSVLTQPSMGQYATAAVGQNMTMVGSQVIGNDLAVQPTLKIREGYPFNVYVNKTIIMDGPYKNEGKQ